MLIDKMNYVWRYILWITCSIFYFRTKVNFIVIIIYATYFPTSHFYAQHYFTNHLIQVPLLLQFISSFLGISILYFAQKFQPSCLQYLCWLWQRSRNISCHCFALITLPTIWLLLSVRPSQLYFQLGFCLHFDLHAD